MKAVANKELDFTELYLKWLKANTEQCRINDDTFRITLPFLDRNNDEIEMYVIIKGDGTYLITDDGQTIQELEFSGFEFGRSERRRKILNSIVSSYGVDLTDDNELIVMCAETDLPVKKHMLAQCMIKVSDMYQLSRPNVQAIFIEDVRSFFDTNNVRYVPNINITGKSKLESHYDFAIARSQNAPERLVKVVNNMDLGAAKNVIFAWNDTKETRDKDSRLITFIYDEDKKVSSDAIGALKEYGITPALWTERNVHLGDLIA